MMRLRFLLSCIYLGSCNRYALELGGDNYDCFSLSEFAPGDQVCIRDKDESVSSIPTEATDVFSVSEHVIALENALKRRANDQNPFDVDWKRAEAVYHRDLAQRMWSNILKEGVELVREKAMKIVIREAQLGVRSYINSLASLDSNRQFTPDHEWVFYILKGRLEDMLKQIHQDLLFEATHNLYKTAPKRFKELKKRLICARSQATNVIDRIELSRDSTERFQIFDSGLEKQVKNTRWGLTYHRSRWFTPVVFYLSDKFSRDEMQACLTQSHDRTRTHNVIIDVRKLLWHAASAELEAEYVTWTVKDAISCHNLLSFSTLMNKAWCFWRRRDEGTWCRDEQISRVLLRENLAALGSLTLCRLKTVRIANSLYQNSSLLSSLLFHSWCSRKFIYQCKYSIAADYTNADWKMTQITLASDWRKRSIRRI